MNFGQTIFSLPLQLEFFRTILRLSNRNCFYPCHKYLREVLIGKVIFIRSPFKLLSTLCSIKIKLLWKVCPLTLLLYRKNITNCNNHQEEVTKIEMLCMPLQKACSIYKNWFNLDWTLIRIIGWQRSFSDFDSRIVTVVLIKESEQKWRKERPL